MIYSDDAGKTWQLGKDVGTDCTECQVAERASGELVLNARTIQGKALRTTAKSKDGGATWSQAEFDANLFDPNCQARSIG